MVGNPIPLFFKLIRLILFISPMCHPQNIHHRQVTVKQLHISLKTNPYLIFLVLGRATGARIAKVLRNSIRRSVRRFRRSEDVRPDVEGPSNNIPSISSRMPDSAVNSVNDFIRTRIQRQTEPSLENLLMSDLSVNSCGIQNEANHNSTNHQW